MRLAKIVLRDALLNFDKLYTYLIPSIYETSVYVGSRVLIPFGSANRKVEGFVLEISNEDNAGKLKELIKPLDAGAILHQDQIQLAGLLTQRYACTWGQALRLMLPSTMTIKIELSLSLGSLAQNLWFEEKSEDIDTVLEQSKLIFGPYLQSIDVNLQSDAIKIMAMLVSSPKRHLSLKKIAKDLGFTKDTWLICMNLVKKLQAAELILLHEKIKDGMRAKTETSVFLPERELAIELVNSESLRSLNQLRVLELLIEYGEVTVADCMAACSVSRSIITTMVKKGYIAYGSLPPQEEEPLQESAITPSNLVLTDEQKAVLASLQADLVSAAQDSNHKANLLKEHLLFGITGSGKTEIYLQLTQMAIEQGRGVIILVPEIALTPQMTARFRSRFGYNIAVLHSRLTPRQRFAEWRRLFMGEAKIAVGARSAIFAPVRNLGLVVVDEEQEESYIADTHPRYDARAVARLRCLNSKALLVLGSATPSIESYYRTEVGKSQLDVLTKRPGISVLPTVKIVDMKLENQKGNFGPFSSELIMAIKTCLEKGEQAIILLNRRGFASSTICQNCGYSSICSNCSVNMTYHQQGKRLICHYCGAIAYFKKRCPNCDSQQILTKGLGIQQAEHNLGLIFPNARILRMDQDTTAARLSHSEILDKFSNHEADILIGTQMVAKGHDFPNVSLVGILAAEKSLFTGNYQASERAFQLFTQAAGRAGRGQIKGQVLMQTYNPDDYAIVAAVKQDYLSFYRQEIAYRQFLNYPPIGSLLQLTVSGAVEGLVKNFINMLEYDLQERFSNHYGFDNLVIFKPERAPVWLINNRYYWQLTLKAANAKVLAKIMTFVAKLIMQSDVRLSFNLDPGTGKRQTD